MTTTPQVTNVKRHAGIAGQYSVTADVTYPGEATERIEFVGSTYGGPIVMITPAGTQTFVTNAERFGEFGTDWLRRFFGSPQTCAQCGATEPSDDPTPDHRYLCANCL